MVLSVGHTVVCLWVDDSWLCCCAAVFLSVGRAVVILTQAGARLQCSWDRGAGLCVCCCSRAGGRCTCSSSPPVGQDVPHAGSCHRRSRGWFLTVEYGGGGGACVVGFVGTGAALFVFSLDPCLISLPCCSSYLVRCDLTQSLQWLGLDGR